MKKLLKENKGKLIISSLIIVLPMLFGIVGKAFLPEEIAVHWGLDGAADGWMNSSLIFFVLPAILLAVHWLCMILTVVIDKNVEQNKTMFDLMFWILPIISLASCGSIFVGALGYTTKMPLFVFLLLGVVFIIIGNYMPKVKRSLTMGIKIKYTLANDDNWYATHRFAGKLYVAIGFLCLLAIPLPVAAVPFVLIAVIPLCVIPPYLYSYFFYKKQIKEGKVSKEDYEVAFGELVKNKKAAVIVAVVITAVLLIALIPLMFFGKIEANVGENAMTIKASFSSEVTIDYTDIDAVEYRAEGVDGTRVAGFGSAKLLLGTFQNEEFGNYTRYTTTGEKPCIVLTVDEKIIVIGLESPDATKEIYDRLVCELAQ